MADIKAFRAIRYSIKQGRDLSDLVAPPYDVLDEKSRPALLRKNVRNIVEVDLPHLPAKQVGPDAVYVKAAATLQQWLDDGVLSRDVLPGIYAYTQVFSYHGKEYRRRGFIALVKLEPFSTPVHPTSVVPHEKTYASAIEDRLKLTRATGAQLSPIFGLFPDVQGEVNETLYGQLGAPPITATLDGVRSELWPVTDAKVIDAVTSAMQSKKVYIADGHHRYTMALAYQKEVAEKSGGVLPADHPANWCMFVLLSMHDPGCVILPTHRIVGNISAFNIDTLKSKLSATFDMSEAVHTHADMPAFEVWLAQQPQTVFGLYVAASKKLYVLRLKQADVLKAFEPTQSDAWRGLDVAILRRYLLDEIIAPAFAGGQELKLAYTADAAEVPGMTDGDLYKIAIILRPTPLKALEDLGTHGEVMPQKSTYFYPKLATGLTINPVK
jgi:uncharacterized protein (DUF1015 family)